MSQAPSCICIVPESELPDITVKPSRFVVVSEAEVSDQWRERVCDWMIKAKCLYLMSWGDEALVWEAAMDFANIREFDNRDIPEDKFIYTTCHHDDALDHVFWFAKALACHPHVDLVRTVILNIASTNRNAELLHIYKRARPRAKSPRRI